MKIKSCRVLIKAQEMENNSHYGKERARVKKKQQTMVSVVI